MASRQHVTIIIRQGAVPTCVAYPKPKVFKLTINVTMTKTDLLFIEKNIYDVVNSLTERYKNT